MLILRLTVTCAFLIAFSFFITSSLAHNPTVVLSSNTGGALPLQQLHLSDSYPSDHPSITARAGAKKKMKTGNPLVQKNPIVCSERSCQKTLTHHQMPLSKRPRETKHISSPPVTNSIQIQPSPTSSRSRSRFRAKENTESSAFRPAGGCGKINGNTAQTA